MKKRLIKIVIATILFIIGLTVKFQDDLINKGIFVIAYFIAGFEIVMKAIRNIFRGKVFDENFLMTVATVGAFAIGEFPEAVGVMLFYQVGEIFQDYAVDKSRKSIADLMNIRPDYANLKKDNDIKKVEPEDVEIGNEIIVKPGEKIPLDGIIVEGNSMIDTSALTGESIPKSVKEGDEVLSGSINQNGVITIKVTKKYEDSTVSKILELVESASNRKSKSENFISKFAKYYTPTVVIIAIFLAIIPTILFNDEFKVWLYRALTFLVVSCPCALVISIPLGFFGGIGGASKKGILIKGSNYLEALSKTEIIVFDKTGTLTKGVFDVQKIEAVNIEKNELLRLVAHCENFSTHPVANSIKRAYNQKIDHKIIFSKQELSGKGIIAKVEGKEIIAGNDKLMKEKGITFKECNEIGTTIYVAIEGEYKGYILISDSIKKDSEKAIRDLKSNGIKKTIMLTGDKKSVGEEVSKKLKLNETYTELLPTDKVNIVEKYMKQKEKDSKLIFVGDGINDAPVLAISDIGIAMGGVGSDAAIEAADIVIMTDELSKIVDSIKISRKTMKIVKENIIFAIAVKIIVLFLSAFGITNMWAAVFADVGVSILAILNSLRTVIGK